jgi:hypothetical protein
MRTAALFAGSIVGVGLYLVAAATFGFSPTWIGLGVLAISLTAAISMVLGGGPASRSVAS